jgi:predicted component of type VI protein secretion system
MRNVMILVALFIVTIIGYQLASPYLEKQGIDMNLTAVEDTNVEKH